MRLGNGDVGDIELFGENQRHDLDTDAQRLRGQEWRWTELGIVTDRQIFGGKRSVNERQTEIAELYFAA